MPFSQTPPTRDEWEHQRLRITKLYIDEDKTLEKVMTTMAREHSFRATVPMYKKRIRDWDLKKNHRKRNTRAIFRKQTQRSAVGKPSFFTLDGQPVDTPWSTGICGDVLQEVCIDPRVLKFPGIHGWVFQEDCIDPRVLEIPGTYQSVTSYRPAFSPCEWYPAWREYRSQSIPRDANVHPLVEALRSLTIPANTYEDRKAKEFLDQKWDLIKCKLKEIFKNDAQTNKHLFKPGHLGRHPPHILDTSSMSNMMIDARKNLITTRKYLSLYLHQLQCSLCRPKLSMDFEDGKECYPISVTAEAVLNLQDASLPELLHYCWCIFGSISLTNSNYQYRSFTRTLFPLLVQVFSLGTLAGKSVCIDIAWCNIQWRNIGEAITILKQIFGQDFGFILWLSQLRDNAHVVLDRPGWNEKQGSTSDLIGASQLLHEFNTVKRSPFCNGSVTTTRDLGMASWWKNSHMAFRKITSHNG